MAALTSKKFSTLVGDFATAVQGGSAKLVDFTIGSVLRAVAEASSGVALWVQALAYQILATSRLSTSLGNDVDTFVNDFGMYRLPAASATGLVIFSRYTPTLSATVPVGARVASGDGSQAFLVTGNPFSPYWNGTDGYLMPSGLASLAVPVQAVNTGAQANIAAAAIRLLQTSISGVDTVTNAVPFTSGVDAETDIAVKRRFVLYLASLAKATDGAIGYAVSSLQQGVQYKLHDSLGLVKVYLDDGTGGASNDLIDRAQASVDLARAGGVRAVVLPAKRIDASVQMTLGFVDGYFNASVAGQAASSISAYINALGIEAPLRFTELIHIAYTTPGVNNVSNVLLNGDKLDITPAAGETIKSLNVAVA